MTVDLPPDSTTVAVWWLRRVGSLAVSTTLPKTLPTTGFVQVQVVGGSPEIYTDVRRPLVQIDCWAPGVGSGNDPDWKTAGQLAELARSVVNSSTGYDGTKKVPDYAPFRVLGVHLVSEPRRVTDDPRGFARYTMDAQFYWIAQAQEISA